MNSEKIEKLREILLRLGYTADPKARNFTEEARGIEIGQLQVPIPGGKTGPSTITIPSAFNQ